MVPFPPADSPSKPKIRTVLAHCPLSNVKRRKKEHPRVPGMYDTSASETASGHHDAADHPLVGRTLFWGDYCFRRIRMNTLGHLSIQEGPFPPF